VNMVSQGIIDDPVFSIYLSSQNGSKSSEIYFGVIDKDKYTGEIHYVPLNSETYWQIKLDGALMNGKPVTKAVNAIVDSGTSLLVGPTADVTKIAKLVGAQSMGQGMYTVDCTKIQNLPKLTFVLNGFNFDLNGADYVERMSQDNQPDICLLAISGMDTGKIPMWILGDVFMRKYYSIFDYANQRMGLALSIAD